MTIKENCEDARVPLYPSLPSAVTYARALGHWILDPSAEEERLACGATTTSFRAV